MRTLGALIAAAVLLSLPAIAAESTSVDCHVGMYQLGDGTRVDIAPSERTNLRWRRFDGNTGALHHQADGTWLSTFGWTDRPDGNTVSFGDCASDDIRFSGVVGHRTAFDVTDTLFQSKDVTLAGRLVLPKGHGRVPIAVLLHGAERSSAKTFYSLQRMLPAEGIGVFVYDKRGTGESGGKYTQDFDLLADDAVAALRAARRLAGPRAGRIGYQAGSQGGWVAPIAATRTPVDFVVVCFGLAVSVIDEDRQEVELEMKLKGHTPAEIAKALEVAKAAELVMTSGFTQGLEHFDALRARYINEPWYKDLRGNLTRYLLPLSSEEIRETSSQFKFGTPWFYDPMPTLQKVRAPQLWILGQDDLEAPSTETSRRLKRLIKQGRPITLVVIPGAEHGMTEYEMDAQGERVSTRYAPGYFAMMRDFIKNRRLSGRYGALSGERH